VNKMLSYLGKVEALALGGGFQNAPSVEFSMLTVYKKALICGSPMRVQCSLRWLEGTQSPSKLLRKADENRRNDMNSGLVTVAPSIYT
jgi:hypothetical protein